MAKRHLEPGHGRKAAGPLLDLSVQDFANLANRFEDEFLGDKSPETKGTYRRSLNEFRRWLEVDDDFRFRKEDVERYKEFLMTEKRLLPVSVSTYLTALRRFCEFLVGEGKLNANPAASVKGNRRPPGHTRPVMTESEVTRLLSTVDTATVLGKRDIAIMHTMLYSGLSEIEIVRADLQDLEQTLMGWYLRVQGKGRSEKDQHVPVDPPVMTRLRIYLDARRRIRPDHPLFVSHGHRSDGERLNTRTVRNRITGYLQASGLKKMGYSPHSLTHTAAVLWLQDGMPLEEVRARMRHGTAETTKIYLRRVEADRR